LSGGSDSGADSESACDISVESAVHSFTLLTFSDVRCCGDVCHQQIQINHSRYYLNNLYSSDPSTPCFPYLIARSTSITGVSMSLSFLGSLLLLVVGAAHVFFFYLESLTWLRGTAKAFGVKSEHMVPTATLAANQGFYNLALAAGCVWAVMLNRELGPQVLFATTVVCCGIIGYITTGSIKILQGQLAPAALSLFCLVSGASKDSGIGFLGSLLILASIAGTVAVSQFVKARIEADTLTHHAKRARTTATAE